MTEKTTVGELVEAMNAGTYDREQVAEALKSLTVIHWDAEVTRPEPEIEQELEAG